MTIVAAFDIGKKNFAWYAEIIPSIKKRDIYSS